MVRYTSIGNSTRTVTETRRSLKMQPVRQGAGTPSGRNSRSATCMAPVTSSSHFQAMSGNEAPHTHPDTVLDLWLYAGSCSARSCSWYERFQTHPALYKILQCRPFDNSSGLTKRQSKPAWSTSRSRMAR